jgi:signal transduction histidine kinase
LLVTDCGGALALCKEDSSLLGHPLTEITPEFIGYEDQLAALLDGTLPLLRLDLVNRENEQGELIYLILTASPYKDANQQIQGILHLLEDVTVAGNTTQQLTQQHNELYLLHQRLRSTNLQLAAANAELQALDELKSRFVSIAAHELRTPIASMLGYVDFMLLDDQEPLSAVQHNNLRVVERSARRLLTITSDLLDVTRLEVGRLELILESVNLAALVRAVLHEFHHEITDKQLDVTLTIAEKLPAVLCDEKRTIQIFSNLISNAIKYTPNQGKIEIHLHQQPQPVPKKPQSNAATDDQEGHIYQSDKERIAGNDQPAVVTAAITDNGIGIPATDLSNMGKAFFRASNVYKARVNGTGLGLHITQSLCELQGGHLWIESVEGQGSTFFVTLAVDDGIFDTVLTRSC